MFDILKFFIANKAKLPGYAHYLPANYLQTKKPEN